MGDLGDISNFMKDGSLADLDWLDVDEKQYREESALPKQNLDIQPDLLALWDREDKPSTTYLVPNVVPVPPFKGAGEPHTMGDMSQAHGPLRQRAEEIRKIARVALMQSPDPRRLRDVLAKRFDMDTLRANRDVLAEVLKERGLLGKLYINAQDFQCETGHKLPGQFVRKFANEAPYVLAKEACTGCMHANTSPTGGHNCAVFHKEIVMDVPYTEQLAQAVENSQKAKGKEVQASHADPKERIRSAMLAPDGSRSAASGAYQGQGLSFVRQPVGVSADVADAGLIQATDLLKKKRVEAQRALTAAPIIEFLRREMLKGHDATELVKGLKLSFSIDDLKETRSLWEPIFKEAGLYGHIYSTQESFADCGVGADFLAKHNPGIRAIVKGSKCESCIYNKAARCMLYGKSLVKEASELLTKETAEAVLVEHRSAGRLPAWEKQASSFGSNPREQIKSMHRSAAQGTIVPTGQARLDLVKAYHGGTQAHSTAEITKREVVKTARRYLDEGLYGPQLLQALRLKFDPRDIMAAKEELRPVIAEQGLQGIYYMDPSIYADYGRGCEEAMRKHRSNGIKYAKVGPKCASCVLQTRSGFCSKLSKELVTEPPYENKLEQQKAILASGPSDRVTEASLVQTPNIMHEYQMQHGAMDIEVNAAEESRPKVQIEFNNRQIKL
jgi:hypothetical protein